MWNSGDELPGISNDFELPPPPFPKRTFKKDINVGDICYRTSKDEINDIVSNACVEWQNLDNEILYENLPSHRHRGAYFIALPPLINIFNLNRSQFNDLHHNRIPDDRKIEYLNRLADIFEKVPKYETLQKRISEISLHTLQLKRQIDAIPGHKIPKALRSYAKDDCSRPSEISANGQGLGISSHHNQDEIDSNSPLHGNTPQTSSTTNEYTSSSSSSCSIPTNTNIMTFVLTTSASEPELEQSIDIPGNMTLAHLQSALYCVQNYLPAQDEAAGSFFFIEGVFYINDPNNQLIDTGDSYLINPMNNSINNDDDEEDNDYGSDENENISIMLEKSLQSILEIRKWLQNTHHNYNHNQHRVSGSSSTEHIVVQPQEILSEDIDIFQQQQQQPKKRRRVTVAKSIKTKTRRERALESQRRDIFTGQTSNSNHNGSINNSQSHSQSWCILRQQDTEIGKLQLRLGMKYLFCHQSGRCEHFLFCSDIHLYNPHMDPVAVEAYPRITYQTINKRRRCSICLAWSARYVVFGDRLSDMNPTFYSCDSRNTALDESFKLSNLTTSCVKSKICRTQLSAKNEMLTEDSSGRIKTFYGDNRVKFQTDLMWSSCSECPKSACWCLCQCFPFTSCCTQYFLRRKVLEGDMTKYSCFQGYFNCCCFKAGSCQEQSCPDLCLCLEALCCNCLAISASRVYVMEKYNLESDPCDYRLIRINNCLQMLACVCGILALFVPELRELSQCINCIADLFYHTLSGCMTAQIAHEMNYQLKNAGQAIATVPAYPVYPMEK
eukprot:gene8654-17857_t